MSVFFKRDIGWTDVFGGGPIAFASGSPKALQLAPVYAAVSLIADQFASLPQHVYERTDGARRQVAAPDWLLRPAPGISTFEWRYQYTTSLKLRGNAYGYVVGPIHKPVGMKWLHPDSVSITHPSKTGPVYQIGTVEERPWSQGGRIVHIREFIEPGSIKGLSPIRMFARTFEVGHYAAEFGRKFFESNGTPTSLLMAKSKLAAGAAREARDLFRDAVTEGGPVTLSQDWTFEKLTIDPQEAQFLATIKANATVIASIFRVPPEDIGGEAGNSRTYGNREADAERFNVRTMLPHVTRFELAMGELLPPGQFLKLNMDALTRPNLIDRVRANAEALRSGQVFHDEVRAQEDRPPATPEQIAFWKDHYLTTNSTSESQATSLALAVEEAVAKQLAEQITKEEQ